MEILKPARIGLAECPQTPTQYTCALPAHDARTYHNAQWDDYLGRPLLFRWQAPLELSVTAWASHGVDHLHGTAGFGFWNHPFMPGEGLARGVRVPQAVWFFFASPPSNMALAKGVAGRGWKAATFDAWNPLFFSLLPLSPLGFLAMRNAALYRRLWPVGQRALNVSEKMLDVDLATPHHYRLRWEKHQVTFWVDDVVAHHTTRSPKGKLGFVVWLDNQYAIVTPQGNFGLGLVERPTAQHLTLENITITPLA